MHNCHTEGGSSESGGRIDMNISDEELLTIKQRYGIVGNSSLLNYAIKVAIQVANTEMTVLISGESGTGKESFSKIIHSLSTRKHGQFIAINCGAIPEGTIDSELFGHEKGSFTGALDSRKGYFEVSNGGTIFLDEIGEMPLSTQARLLRVLEYGEFIKVGSSKVMKTDVRVVAATNVNLIEAVEKGDFREDLYYRLNTVPILVPPLRERGNDVELLFRKFASDYAETYRVKPLILTDEAKKIVTQFRWPGNIRQLKNTVERMSVLELDRKVTGETMMKYLPQEGNMMPTLYRPQSQAEGEKFTERDILYKVLFDMRKDMDELKKLVFRLSKQDQVNEKIMEEHQDLFEDVKLEHAPTSFNQYLLEQKSKVAPQSPVEEEFEASDIEDISHIAEEDDSLSLERNEKELILRALRKYNNKRKYAAQDLGISERTLYRKLKQYEIDD